MNQIDENKKPKQRFPQWVLLAAIAIPILLLAAMFSWRSEEPPEQRVDDEIEQAAEQVAGRAPDQQGQFAVQQATMGDFDAGRQVPSHSATADFWYQARTGSDRFFSPQGDAALAILGRTDMPRLDEVKSALHDRTVQELDVNDMSPGLWIAARTSEGHFAAFTIKSHAGISPGTLRLDYLLWENKDAGREVNQ